MKIIIAAALLAAAGTASADEVTVSGINIKDVVSYTRGGVWLPMEGGKTFTVVYAPLVQVHGDSGTEYAALDVGAAAPGKISAGYAFAAIGFRLDNILARLAGVSIGAKKHITAAKLPAIEIGAGPIFYMNKIRFGVSAAIKF